MALAEDSGNVTMNGTEQNMFASQTDLKYYSSYVFLHNMASGDTIRIRVYVKDVDDAVERVYEDQTASDAQTVPAIFIPFLPTSSYRVTCQQTAGTNRVVNWAKYEQ